MMVDRRPLTLLDFMESTVPSRNELSLLERLDPEGWMDSLSEFMVASAEERAVPLAGISIDPMLSEFEGKASQDQGIVLGDYSWVPFLHEWSHFICASVLGWTAVLSRESWADWVAEAYARSLWYSAHPESSPAAMSVVNMGSNQVMRSEDVMKMIVQSNIRDPGAIVTCIAVSYCSQMINIQT